MIRKGPRSPRIAPAPQIRDSRRFDERSPRPEPRLRHKHALNAPIVTIFGAGVGGLTAAHELVERGFIVQVVEAAEDPHCPGRPLVGGMAANQRARVRANVEDLQREVLELSWQDDEAGAVARWLLKLFTFNRSRWLSTERPERLHHSLYTLPSEPQWESFRSSLVADLQRARERYRQQWLWDLIVRGVMLGAVRYRSETSDREELLHAQRVYEQAQQDSTEQLALRLLGVQSGSATSEHPSRELVERYMGELVVPALEREFLCFRLVPHARRGFESSAEHARQLYGEWSSFFLAAFPYSCVSDASRQERILVTESATPPDLPTDPHAWLEIDVIEQRLPGEHGYRFFPSFYHHLDDTLRRIPLFIGEHPTGLTVFDNLKPTVFQGIGFSAADRDKMALSGGRVSDEQDDPRVCPAHHDPRSTVVVELHRDRPKSLEGIRNRTDHFVRRIGGTRRDAILLLSKLVRYMTSSPERRRKEYENQTWADFLDKQRFSPPMQEHIQSAAQALLAFSAQEADARTYGNVALQMMFDQLDDGRRVDRTLNGPTSDAWLEPWREYLEKHGVRFFQRRLKELTLTEHGLVPVFEPSPEPASASPERILSQDGYDLLTHAQAYDGLQPDFYVLALNLERTLELIRPLQPTPERAPDFCKLLEFGADVQRHQALKTMTGVQFFFDAKTSIGRGHMYFPLSPWGLSSISQSEFWSVRGSFSDGYYGVLSVDVCKTGAEDGSERGSFWSILRGGASEDEQAPGDEKAPALLVAREVWSQISTRISDRDEIAHPRSFHLDTMVSARRGNESKYLACVAKLDEHRPGRSDDPRCVGDDEIHYALNYDRWVLCGTYMATHTRMTTMESANESARHAARTILRKLTMNDALEAEGGMADGREIQIENLRNKTYNGASPLRIYDLPDIWNLEDMELPDLDIFRRVDRRLLELGLGHFMDIIDFDRKLHHALDAVDLYGSEKPLKELLGAAIAGLDAVLVKELGQGYDAALGGRLQRTRDAVAKLAEDLPAPMFQDMKGLVGRLHQLLETLTR